MKLRMVRDAYAVVYPKYCNDQGWLWPRTRIAHWPLIGPMMPGEHPIGMLAETLARFSREVLREPVEMAAIRPRETVSWYEDIVFFRWLSSRLGFEVRRPTEHEWQQVATGGDPDKVYPWGREWNARMPDGT